jgi:hypothetical protein
MPDGRADERAALDVVKTIHRLYSVSPATSPSGFSSRRVQSALDIARLTYDSSSGSSARSRRSGRVHRRRSSRQRSPPGCTRGAPARHRPTAEGSWTRRAGKDPADRQGECAHPPVHTLEDLFKSVDYCGGIAVSAQPRGYGGPPSLNDRRTTVERKKDLWAIAQGARPRSYDDDFLKPTGARPGGPTSRHCPHLREHQGSVPYIDIVNRIMSSSLPANRSAPSTAARKPR